MQHSTANSITRRPQLSASGGHFEQLCRDICPQRLRNVYRLPHSAPPRPLAPTPLRGNTLASRPANAATAESVHQLARRRATTLGCAGLLRKARAAFGVTTPLGALQPSDASAQGDHGEDTSAIPGSVTAEIPGKHPELDALFADVPFQDGER